MNTTTLKGTVRCITAPHIFQLKGPIKDGLPLEKTLVLEGITGPSMHEAGWLEAREFARKLVLGKRIEFVINTKTFKQDIGHAYIGGEDIALTLLNAGLAYCDTAAKLPVEYTKAEATARKEKKGLFGVGLTTVPKEFLDNSNVPRDKMKTKIPAIVEDINITNFTVYLPSFGRLAKLALADVKVSTISFRNVQEYKHCLDDCLNQKDCLIELLDWDSGNEHFIGYITPADKTDVLKKILAEGFGKLDQTSINSLEVTRFKALREAMEGAQRENLRVWRDYKASAAKTSKSDSTTFLAKVTEVHSGDSLTVESMNTGQSSRVFLANVRSPAFGSLRSPEDRKPYAFEAREFMRKLLVGKPVTVEVEYSKMIPAKDERGDEIERKYTFVTIKHAEKNAGIELLEAGLGTVVAPRLDEDFSKYIKELQEGEAKGKESKLGLHSKKDYKQTRYTDLVAAKNPSRIKEMYSFLATEKRVAAVVEVVFSAVKFIVRLDKQGLFLAVSLAGVKSVFNDSNMPEYLAVSDRGLSFSKDQILQRDVELEFEGCFPNGVLVASVTINKKNYGAIVVSEGFAFVAGKSSSKQEELLQAEVSAKKSKKGIWATSFSKGGVNHADLERLDYKKTVFVCEVLNCREFYVQDSKSKELDVITTEILKIDWSTQKRLASPIQKGTLCVAKFSADGLWYRAKVEKPFKEDKYSVRFLDFGNVDNVSVTNLCLMPDSLKKYKEQAILCSLAYISPPEDRHPVSDDAADFINSNLFEKTLPVHFVYKVGDQHFLDITISKSSLSKSMVSKGLAKVEETIPEVMKTDFEAAQAKAIEGKLGVWGYDEDDEDEF